MVSERLVDGAERRRGQSLGADDDQRFAGMRQPLEIMLLSLREHMQKPVVSGAAIGDVTVAPRGHTWAVAPSPFNTVKFELGVILVGAALLVLAHGRIAISPLGRWLILPAYGLLGMGWLVVRTRRILRNLQAAAQRQSDGPQ